MAIYRHESFLAGKLGEKVACENLTVIDDGTIPGLFGTSPFDDEGVPSRRTVVIERGVLKSYLLNTYAARKLGMKTTGNASRGLTGNAGIGHGNFFIEDGRPNAGADDRGRYQRVLRDRADRLRRQHRDRRLFARRRRACGSATANWRFAVSEVTIAGNLQEMLLGLEAVGSDLEFRGSMAAPTLKIGEMTVGGK